MYKFQKSLLSFLLCALLLAGCGQPQPAASPAEDGEAPSPAEDVKAPSAGEDAGPIDPHDLEIVLPEEYLDLLIVDTELQAEADGRLCPLVSVYEKASVEAAEADFGSGDGYGFLFGIVALDETVLPQYQYSFGDGGIFARGGNWYYAKTAPTDVQFYRGGGISAEVDTESEDWQTWETLDALWDTVQADFIERNGLTPYDGAET